MRYSLRTLVLMALLLPPLCARYWEFLLTQNYGVEGRRQHREAVAKARANGDTPPPMQTIEPLSAVIMTLFNAIPVASVGLWRLAKTPPRPGG
jgi:hypothetical protein